QRRTRRPMAAHEARGRSAEPLPRGFVVGLHKAARHFTATVFDNFGGDRRYTSPGWVGDTLTLENVATSGYLDRFVFQRHGEDAYRVNYTYRNRSGAWQLGDEQSCTRDAQAPQA